MQAIPNNRGGIDPSCVGTAGAVVSDGWPWVGLLVVFAAAFGVGGSLAFGPLIDE